MLLRRRRHNCTNGACRKGFIDSLHLQGGTQLLHKVNIDIDLAVGEGTLRWRYGHSQVMPLSIQQRLCSRGRG